MKLMIIESPGKVKKLSAILGADWKIAASVGHIRDLPHHDTTETQIVAGIEADYRPVYEMTERGGDVVKKLKALASEADEVYLATDPDREGESISWHLQQCLKLKNPLRVAFNEITPSAVKAALMAPRSIDVKRVAAQEARRVLDRLVGYMVSPELMRQQGEILSAGRVQSPAVRLVVERERQIRAFRQTLHFGAMLFFADAKTGEWRSEWQTKPDFVTEDSPYFMDKDFAAAVAGVKSVVVDGFKEGEAKRSPPAPFTTSTMQQAASVALGLDPKAAMEAAQKLYEQGHITYHRTDNPNVSDEALPDIYSVAVKLGLDMADEPRKFKAKDGAQEGHPAITPTHWDVEEAGETDEQRALYKLIRLRAIGCQLADARYAVRKVQLRAESPVNGRAVTFEGTGRTLVYVGWLKLLAGDQTEDEDEGGKEADNPVPFLEVGQVLAVDHGSLLEKKTKAPPRYTLASLVKKLEEEGIGRPATYAAIMDNIVGREYVVVEKKFVKPTPTGEKIVDALVGKFQFVDLGFTRELEDDLDRIAQGQAAYKGVIQRLHEQLEGEISAQQSTVATKFPCPECGKPLRRIQGKKGAFWGCSGHPDCSVSLPDEGGKPGQRKAPEVSNFACAKCGKPLIHREKKGKGGYDFWGCSGFKDGCKTAYPNVKGEPDFGTTK
ncbi:DNA topoisomerase I [Burkholderia diffusa]|uniref:type I DNA topoisomerase n=1 Tax=Burkholderia diffusa TaxID=488732 RepID=UPI000758E2B6|nr:type I DNA topoisomerase [Burkholderia diffusa]KWF77581.1 DNA topoisomerase I [Burkholderia diffusa]